MRSWSLFKAVDVHIRISLLQRKQDNCNSGMALALISQSKLASTMISVAQSKTCFSKRGKYYIPETYQLSVIKEKHASFGLSLVPCVGTSHLVPHRLHYGF